MKILILNGSPKKDKSDTMHLTRAFVAGMQEAVPCEVQDIHAIEQDVRYCTGCFTCMHSRTCIHKDDMSHILQEILQADLLILSFPLYAYGMPAPLKAIVDRLLPLTSMKMQRVGERYVHQTQADVAKLRFCMICGCGFPNSKGNFEPAVSQFGLMFHGDNTVLTVPESPMFNAPEAAEVTVPRLELIKEAGRAYAEQGKIPEPLLATISSPMIPEQVYAKIINGQ